MKILLRKNGMVSSFPTAPLCLTPCQQSTLGVNFSLSAKYKLHCSSNLS